MDFNTSICTKLDPCIEKLNSTADNHPVFSDSKTFECNNSVFDTAEEKPTMKGNQNGILSHSNGYKEDDSLSFPPNDFGNSNVHDSNEGPLSNDIKDGNEFWKVPELDDSIFFYDNNVRDDHNVNLSKIIGENRGGNPFECDIPSSETHEIDAANVTNDQNGGLSNMKRGGNPFECDTKDRDQPWNIPEYSSMIVDFLDDKENETIDSDSPFTSHSELFENTTHSYSDKGVTVADHDLPELTVCYRENNFNMVKDICVDEGVPAVDKVLVESGKDDQPSTSVSVAADEEQQSNRRETVDMGSTPASVSQDSSFEDAKNIVVTHHTEHEAFKPSLENNANKEADKDPYLEDLMMLFGSKCTTNAKAINASEKPSSPNTLVRVDESKFDGDQSTPQPDQVALEQTLKSQTAVSVADETNKKGPESARSTEGGVENLPEASLIPKAVSVHKEANSDTLSAASQVHFASTTDNAHQQPLESQNIANGQCHFADGEASFSAAGGPVSGSITYSGPISHSGSISLRSESSTTSARSFAFPVLQNEWNSSPVRMAKAERRRLQKYKCWRQGLLCCRF